LRARCVLPAAAAAAQHHTASTTTRGSSDDNQQQQQQQLLKQWCQQSSIYYSNYPLHRAAEARTDEARLAAWFNAAHARATPIAGGKVLLRSCDSSPDSISSSSGDTSLAPVWVSPAAELGGALAAAGESGEPPLFLGLDDAGVPHFVVQVSQAVADGVAAAHGGQWRSARTAGPDMAREDAAVMAVASGLAAWNADSQFHGATGAQTTPQVCVCVCVRLSLEPFPG
jgi:NADH pyrophosphatase NudC (nudix superfamily)